MQTFVRRVILGAALSLLAVALLAALAATMFTSFPSGPTARADVPADQTYTGSKRCSSCHFNQFMAWKKTGHSKALENMPAKYQADPACLKCHVTGYGQETGFKTAADSGLAGVTCESCHGPGSKHEEICQQYKNKKELTPEEDAVCKGSIYELMPKACVTCHTAQGHGDPHPEYEKQQ